MKLLLKDRVLWVSFLSKDWGRGFGEGNFQAALKEMHSGASVEMAVLDGRAACAVTTRGLENLKNAVQECLRRGWKPVLLASHPMKLILETLGLSRLVPIETSPELRENTLSAVSDLEKDWLWGPPEEAS